MRYDNDAKNTFEDRNVFIVRLYASEDVYTPLPIGSQFTAEADGVCFVNTQPGTTEIAFTFTNISLNTQHPEASQEAIYLLQETGEIPE